ncbi:MAG: bifunctional phosphoribosyl-AMP cyclohydrolase/phosphoribosyl-ATP diphosphatase HisIE [Nitrospirae bacterium]|nr:MAG: bifunctional phosphoribosyl-AMP cyclohydrolase/phosphoribosyl-ATP diphosphatase HisIE [Nitrospirota bacterium]
MNPTGEDQSLRYDDHGLVPAIVQDWRDGTVLMLGYMNHAAIEATLRTRYVHFWSRSRNRLWQKGETSGHYLLLKHLFADCDQDTILVKAEPVGPTCHTGERSCFFLEVREPGTLGHVPTMHTSGGVVERLYETILERKTTPRANSYVCSLLAGGPDRFLKKIVEEAGEVVLAAKNQHRSDIVYESADLLFHLIVMLGYYDVSPQEIYGELGKRFGQSGIRSQRKSTES